MDRQESQPAQHGKLKKKKKNLAKARSQWCKLGQGQGRELQTEVTTRAKARREDQGVNLGHRRVKEVES